MELSKIHLGDFLDLSCKIQDNCVNLIICDPPYGQTPLLWDSTLDFKYLWSQFNRIIVPNGVILIFGQEPFSSLVRTSNLQDYRYDWYWIKERLTNVFQVRRRPGKIVETISVFYKGQPKYFPQKTEHLGKKVTNKIGDSAKFSETMAGFNVFTKPLEYKDDGTRYPNQILHFNRDNPRNNIHPTQKPVSLVEYLIKTYTEEGDLVLDPCSGSGTIAVAAKLLNRKFICIEKDTEFYQKSIERLSKYE